MDKDQQHFVGEFGLALKQVGLLRTMGRIWGYLLISDPPHQSAESLANSLQASRDSISTTIRSLMQMGLIDKLRRLHAPRVCAVGACHCISDDNGSATSTLVVTPLSTTN